MDAVVAVVGDGLTILGAVASVYLSVGIALAFLEGQLDALTERPTGRDIARRIVLLVVCVAVVALARTVSDHVAALAGGQLDSAQAVRQAVLDIGEYFLDIVIGSAALLLAVGVAMGFVGAQLAAAAGEPVQMSNLWGKLVVIVGLAVGALMTISISHIVIGALR